jgi:hypothetical protein
LIGYNDAALVIVSSGIRPLTETFKSDLESNIEALATIEGSEAVELNTASDAREYQLGRLSCIQALAEADKSKTTGF